MTSVAAAGDCGRIAVSTHLSYHHRVNGEDDHRASLRYQHHVLWLNPTISQHHKQHEQAQAQQHSASVKKEKCDASLITTSTARSTEDKHNISRSRGRSLSMARTKQGDYYGQLKYSYRFDGCRGG